MVVLKIHGSYLVRELLYRWGRTLFVIGGVGLAVSMVILLPVLGQGFQTLARLPFRNLDADLVVQQGPTQSALPEKMGLMLPYSAQPMDRDQWTALGEAPGVTAVLGSVLLWNFAPGKFFSVSGIPLDAENSAIGPGRVGEWLFKGRMPKAGKQEALVERHYGAFYRLKPGKTMEIGGDFFTITGVVDIQQGSQVAAANFYLDIDKAREMAGLEADSINQLFLRVSDPAKAEPAKVFIQTKLPGSTVISADSFLTLLGTLSRLTGQFQQATTAVTAVLALLLLLVFLGGSLGERQREAAVLRAIGWSRNQVRNQLASEAGMQGLVGGMLGVLLTWLASRGLSTLRFTLPNGLRKSDDPAVFLGSQYVPPPLEANLQLSMDASLWLSAPAATAVLCVILGWWLAASRLRGTPWSRVRS